MSKKQTEDQSNKRVYINTQEINHDLFKLMVAKMKKNVSWNTQRPIWEELEHCHLFHTVDSNGKKQTKCNKVGGHFHVIETINNGPDEKPTIVVSKAMHMVRDVDANGIETIVPREIPYDQHTHEVEYLGSHVVKVRQISNEFIKYQAAVEGKKPSKVDGIIG